MITGAPRRDSSVLVRAAFAVDVAVAGCALPPDYPPDTMHLNAGPAECLDCHQQPDEPPMHPSHFDPDGRLKTVRGRCHDCHGASDEVTER